MSTDKIFDVQAPSGHYDLDLSVAYERAIACQLISIAYENDGAQFQNEKMNGWVLKALE